MEVAVARMKHVGDAQARLPWPCDRSPSTPLARRSRNHSVLHNIVRRNAAHCGERCFAAFPNKSPLRIRLRHAYFFRAILAADRANLAHERFHLARGAIQFDKQQTAAHRIVGMDGCFRGFDGERIHDLER